MTGENVFELDEKNFDKEIAKGNWIVDFWAAWCGPCKIMEPHFKEAAKEMKGKVKFGKVDVEKNNELSSRFDVMSIPTIIFFKNGDQVNRVVGAMPKETIIDSIKESF